MFNRIPKKVLSNPKKFYATPICRDLKKGVTTKRVFSLEESLEPLSLRSPDSLESLEILVGFHSLEVL